MLQQAAHHRDGCRLPGPVGAEQTVRLALVDAEAHPANGLELAEALMQIDALKDPARTRRVRSTRSCCPRSHSDRHAATVPDRAAEQHPWRRAASTGKPRNPGAVTCCPPGSPGSVNQPA